MSVNCDGSVGQPRWRGKAAPTFDWCDPSRLHCDGTQATRARPRSTLQFGANKLEPGKYMSQIGRTAEVRWRVPRPRNPRAKGGLSLEADVPAIPANSRVVELMESAAIKLMKPWLSDAES